MFFLTQQASLHLQLCVRAFETLCSEVSEQCWYQLDRRPLGKVAAVLLPIVHVTQL